MHIFALTMYILTMIISSFSFMACWALGSLGVGTVNLFPFLMGVAGVVYTIRQMTK